MRRGAIAVVVVVAALVVVGALGFQLRYLVASRLHWTLGEDPGPLGLAFVRDVPLNGSASRFDYQAIDPERGLLWITHLGADEVVVYDLRQQAVKAYVPGIASPHGVTVVPEIGRAYVSATGTNEVAVIDEDSLQVVARVPAGEFPDGLAYDPGTHRLFVSDESGGADAVIDIRTDTNVGSIDLGGEAGNTQYDSVGKQIVAAAQGRGQLALIDPVAQRVTASIDVPGCDGPHGFAVDAPARRAYVSCEGNAKFVVVDLAGRTALATFGVGDVPDVLSLDATTHRLYVAAESGVVAVFDAHDGTLSKVGQSYLAPAAHTIAVDADTHLVYVPLEDEHGKPVLRVYQAPAR